MTSHAAVVARGMGKCCVAGCGEAVVDEANKKVTINGHVFNEGDWMTLNGSTGDVILGQAPLVEPEIAGSFETLMSWADEVRTLQSTDQCGYPPRCESGPRFRRGRNRSLPDRAHVLWSRARAD